MSKKVVALIVLVVVLAALLVAYFVGGEDLMGFARRGMRMRTPVVKVASPSLTMSLAAVPVVTTQVLGQDNVKFVGMVAFCSAASDCHLTDIALTGYYDSDADNIFAAGGEGGLDLNVAVDRVWIVDGNGYPVASSASVSSAGAVTLDNLTYTIDAGKTEIFYVVGYLSTNATIADNIAFVLADAGISYEGEGGITKTSSGAVNGTTSPTTYVTVVAEVCPKVAISFDSPQGTQAASVNSKVLKFEVSSYDDSDLSVDEIVLYCKSTELDIDKTVNMQVFANNSQVKSSSVNCSGGVTMDMEDGMIAIYEGGSWPMVFEVRYDTNALGADGFSDEGLIFSLDEIKGEVLETGKEWSSKDCKATPLDGNVLFY